MARIKYIAPAAEIAGTIGGVTFARAYGVQTARSWRAPVKQQTTWQRWMRTWLAKLSSQWFETLTAAQRTAWQTYAATCPFTDSLGKTYYIKGNNMMIRTNLILSRTLQPQDLVAPIGTGFPTTRTLTLSLTHATGVLALTGVAPAGGAADRLFFFIYTLQKVTVLNPRLIYLGFQDQPGNVALPFTLYTFPTPLPYSAGDISAWIRFWYYDSDNRVTKPVNYKTDST